MDAKDTFTKVSIKYPGNVNSLHKLGLEAKRLETEASKEILNKLKLNNKEIIYTSGRLEANNLVILGFLDKYKNKNKEVIVSIYEDLSIRDALDSLKDYKFFIHEINKTEDVYNLVNKNTVLICLSGLEITNNDLIKLQDYHKFLEYNPSVNLNYLDFITIYSKDLLGIGALIKNKNLDLLPLFHGGKSTTTFRSGTPALPLIVSFASSIKNKN